MVKIPISDRGRRNGSQPKHGPYGGKDADRLANSKAAAALPSARPVEPVPKPNVKEP